MMISSCVFVVVVVFVFVFFIFQGMYPDWERGGERGVKISENSLLDGEVNNFYFGGGG